jgi:hypothetical protein
MSTSIKRMTTVIVVCIGIAILLTVIAQAQPMRMSVEDHVKILKDSLRLNDDQAIKITRILEDQREEMTTAKVENKDDRKAMRTVMQEIMSKTNEKVKKILTDEQVEQYNKLLKARQQNMGKHKRVRGKS